MKYLGIGPREFDALPFYWRERALAAISAENWAEAEHAAHERSRRKQ